MSKADKSQLGYVGGDRQGRDSDSWYTPAKYLDSARRVLGGIELDPFSSEIANQTVQASRYFTIDDDALLQDWATTKERSVWMNPPFGSTMTLAVDKFVLEFEIGSFDAGILLCNNATDTRWFAKIASRASAFCFTNHRIHFENYDGKALSTNTRGQVFNYFGSDIDKFKQEFTQYGLVLLR